MKGCRDENRSFVFWEVHKPWADYLLRQCYVPNVPPLSDSEWGCAIDVIRQPPSVESLDELTRGFMGRHQACLAHIIRHAFSCAGVVGYPNSCAI